MIRCMAATTLLSLALATNLPAQTSHAARMEALLERLVGQWRMTGSVRGRPATYTLEATRVLQRCASPS
jgi:hypothetical protein